jgi:hypothetical protein
MLKLYPNPTNGQLNVSTDGSIDRVDIFDVSGRKLGTINTSNEPKIIINLLDISGGKGVFILKFSNKNNNVFKKVIVN